MSKKEISELESQIKQMQETIEKLKKENDDKAKELDKYKLPRVKNQKYYHIAKFTRGIDIDCNIESMDKFDNSNYAQYNYFTNENKAQQYVDHIKLELELFQIRDIINNDWIPDWKDKDEVKYVIENSVNQINLYHYFSVYTPFAFETEEKRDKFIELVGKDKIIEYLSF